MALQFYKVDGETFIGPEEQGKKGLHNLAAVDGERTFEGKVAAFLTLQNVNQLTSFTQLDNSSVRGIPFSAEEKAQAEYLGNCFAMVKEQAIHHVENQQFLKIVGK